MALSKKRSGKLVLLSLFLLFSFLLFLSIEKERESIKLFWFIPDGFRADPDLFNIYEWAEKGELPNIKKMMDNGAYGFSTPVFPTYSPPNFASLLTGTYPSVHGITDAPMRIEGDRLDSPSGQGFASTPRKVPTIWSILLNYGKKILILSIPGSTPPEYPENPNIIVIRGRANQWGPNVESLIVESKEKQAERELYKFRVIGTTENFIGKMTSFFVEKTYAKNWENVLESYSRPLEMNFTAYGLTIHAYIFDSTDDRKTNYDKMIFSLDKMDFLANLKQGEWSEWIPIKLRNSRHNLFDSHVKIKIIKLWEDGTFRLAFFYDNINKFNTQPPTIADEVVKHIGPMADLNDMWSTQLNLEPEDKQTFLEEINMTLSWHRNATRFFHQKYKPDVFIQEVYVPNMMLESRWWMGEVDKTRKDYSFERAEEAWKDILWMYKQIDAIIGETIENSGKNTLIVLSSDHGVSPLHYRFLVNNLFAEIGWLNFTIDQKTGMSIVDWTKTKVVYLRTAHVWINPNNLEGGWHRLNGTEYENLRNQVIDVLNNITDSDGNKVIAKVLKWEDASKELRLPADRIGDLVLIGHEKYDLSEEMDSSLRLFIEPLKTGHKNSVDPNEKSIWTPFVIMGPGVKKGVQLKEPIRHVDQMPTILKLMKVDVPNYVQGRVLTEIIS